MKRRVSATLLTFLALLGAAGSACTPRDGAPTSSATSAHAVPAAADPLAAAGWRALLTDLRTGTPDAIDQFALMDPQTLRDARYTIDPGPSGGLADAGRAVIAGLTIEPDSAGLRKLDALITAHVAEVGAEAAAATLDRMDNLLAGLMQSAADQDALHLYAMTGAWRGQVLTRLQQLGHAGERFNAAERVARVRSALAAPSLPREVP